MYFVHFYTRNHVNFGTFFAQFRHLHGFFNFILYVRLYRWHFIEISKKLHNFPLNIYTRKLGIHSFSRKIKKISFFFKYSCVCVCVHSEEDSIGMTISIEFCYQIICYTMRYSQLILSETISYETGFSHV